MKIVRDKLGKKNLDEKLKEGLAKWKANSLPSRREIFDFVTGKPYKTSAKYSIDSVWEEKKNQKQKLWESLEKVRLQEYDVLTDQFFESSSLLHSSLHSSLHLSLAYSAAAKTSLNGIVSVFDVSSSLLDYEDTLQNPRVVNKVDPLYLLAHARLAFLQGFEYQSIALVREFKTYFPDYVSWLSEQEREEVDPHPNISSNVLETSSDDVDEIQTEATLSGPFATVKDEWIAIKKIYDLTPDKTEAMDELMELTGLDSVKRQGIDIFIAVFADKRLRDEHNARNESGKLETSNVLNFSFLGNPGTGK